MAIGPLGQGGAGIIQLGVVAKKMNSFDPSFATSLYTVGVFIGLIMWSYAILWIVFAVVTIATRIPRIRFSIGWWGFIFPLGTYNQFQFHSRSDSIKVHSHYVP